MASHTLLNKLGASYNFYLLNQPSSTSICVSQNNKVLEPLIHDLFAQFQEDDRILKARIQGCICAINELSAVLGLDASTQAFIGNDIEQLEATRGQLVQVLIHNQTKLDNTAAIGNLLEQLEAMYVELPELRTYEPLQDASSARIYALKEQLCDTQRLLATRKIEVQESFAAFVAAYVVCGTDIPATAREFLIEIGSSDVLPIFPVSLPLKLEFLESVKLQTAGLVAHNYKQLSVLTDIIRDIGGLCEELGIPAMELEKDTSKLSQYLGTLASLQLQWKNKMKASVDNLLTSLQELWQLSHVSQLDQSQFLTNLEPMMYTPNAVCVLEAEIGAVRKRNEETRTIYTLLNQRTELIKKMQRFEISASDPRRLFRPSFQLLEEEKFRKTSYPLLLSIEANLRVAVHNFQTDTQQRFSIDGAEFLNAFEDEIHARFFNTSVFLDKRSSNNHRPELGRSSSADTLINDPCAINDPNKDGKARRRLSSISSYAK